MRNKQKELFLENNENSQAANNVIQHISIQTCILLALYMMIS